MVDQPIAEPVNREVLDKRRSLRNASGTLLDIHRLILVHPVAATFIAPRIAAKRPTAIWAGIGALMVTVAG